MTTVYDQELPGMPEAPPPPHTTVQVTTWEGKTQIYNYVKNWFLDEKSLVIVLQNSDRATFADGVWAQAESYTR